MSDSKTKDKDLKIKEKQSSLDVYARLRFLRMSPRKVRAVANTVKNMPALSAVDYLKLVNKRASVPLAKLIYSAISNGEHNFGINKDNLFIKKITVNEGPSLKRYRPRAYGRASLIKKRSSHIEVWLGELKPSEKKSHIVKSEKKENASIETIAPRQVKQLDQVSKEQKIEQKEKQKKKSDFIKKIFSRKTG